MIENNDKAIDGLLRALAKRPGADDRIEGGHIDADEISIFAENALPEKAKARVVSHLADCGRCRTILSNVISLRAAEPADSSVETAAGAALSFEIPWYRKLFAVRNLATAMGVLVVLFAGFFAVFLFRNMGGAGSSVAQLSNTENAAPAVDMDELTAADSASNSNAVIPDSNASANEPGEMTNGPSAPAETERKELDEEALGREDDGAARAKDDGFADARPADLPVNGRRTQKLSELRSRPDTKMTPSAAPPPPPPPQVATTDSTVARTEAAEAAPARDRDAAKAGSQIAGNVAKKEKDPGTERQVAGKTFNLKGSVWYDSAYAGQSTTNVRRRTAEFSKLDSGLRTIAGQLSGTVVVVWKEKAYRID